MIDLEAPASRHTHVATFPHRGVITQDRIGLRRGRIGISIETQAPLAESTAHPGNIQCDASALAHNSS